jgi:hypothetical protein
MYIFSSILLSLFLYLIYSTCIVGLIIELFNRYFDTTDTFRSTFGLFRNTIALIVLLECARDNIGNIRSTDILPTRMFIGRILARACIRTFSHLLIPSPFRSLTAPNIYHYAIMCVIRKFGSAMLYNSVHVAL